MDNENARLKLYESPRKMPIPVKHIATNFTATTGALQEVPSKKGCNIYSEHAKMMAAVDGFKMKFDTKLNTNAIIPPYISKK